MAGISRNESRGAAAAQIYLQPIAAPSILGLFGFAGATFIVAAHMAHWYGGANTDLYVASFAATFGGLAQFMAGMWAFKARDAVATAMHGMWARSGLPTAYSSTSSIRGASPANRSVFGIGIL